MTDNKLLKIETHDDESYTEYGCEYINENSMQVFKKTYTSEGVLAYLETYSEMDFTDCIELVQYGYENQEGEVSYPECNYTPDSGYYNYRVILDPLNRIVLKLLYEDETFNQITDKTIIVYSEDGNRSELNIDCSAVESNIGYAANKNVFDSQERPIVHIIYKDIDCQEKLSMETIEYSDDGNCSVQKTIYYDADYIALNKTASKKTINNYLENSFSITNYYDAEFTNIKDVEVSRVLKDGSNEKVYFTNEESEGPCFAFKSTQDAEQTKIITERFYDKEMTCLMQEEEVICNPQGLVQYINCKTYSKAGELTDITIYEYDEEGNIINSEEEPKEFDYISIADSFKKDAVSFIPNDISEDDKNYIIEKIGNYIICAGQAIMNNQELKTTAEQKMFITQLIMELTFYAAIGIVQAEFPTSLRDSFLQNIAFIIYEITEKAIKENQEMESILTIITELVKNTYKEQLNNFLKAGAITEECFKKALDLTNFLND